MGRTPGFVCGDCGAASARWSGRCGGCGAWNSVAPAGPGAGPAPPASVPVPLSSVDPAGASPCPTGVDEFDRVLSGGLCPGSVTLLFGEPGVGKSTLVLAVLSGLAGRGERALLVSAEESPSQVRARAARLGAVPDHLLVLAGSDLDALEAAAEACAPGVLVVDSVQTVADPALDAPAGSLSQVRRCAERLAARARRCGVAVVLVGHVTKGGDLAGPRALEHLVDTVLTVEGDRHHALRALRCLKHRFGPTGELGLFEMTEQGLRGVDDPGRLLLGDRRPEVPGSAVTPLLEGRRPLLAEVQALTVRAAPGSGGGRRNAQGLDARRLGVLMAVLERRGGVVLSGVEVFASLAGGIRTAEPSTDLPLALAVASSVTGRAVPGDLVSFGEVGLAGEVRQVVGSERRLAEAGRMGFRRALVPAATPEGPAGMALVRVSSLREALTALPHRPAAALADTAVPLATMPPWPNRSASR